jgi:hypothetical protein
VEVGVGCWVGLTGAVCRILEKCWFRIVKTLSLFFLGGGEASFLQCLQ